MINNFYLKGNEWEMKTHDGDAFIKRNGAIAILVTYSFIVGGT